MTYIPVLPDATVKSFKVTISAADVLTAHTNRVILVSAPGAGYTIECITASIKVLYNTIAYATNLTGTIISGTALSNPFGSQIIFTNALAATLTREITYTKATTFGATTKCFIENEGLYFTVNTGDPTLGNSDIVVYGLYRIKAI